MPSWASEATSFTPRRPPRRSFHRNLTQNVGASEGLMSMPSTLRRLSVDVDGDDRRDRDDAMVAVYFDVGRVEPDVGPAHSDENDSARDPNAVLVVAREAPPPRPVPLVARRRSGWPTNGASITAWVVAALAT